MVTLEKLLNQSCTQLTLINSHGNISHMVETAVITETPDVKNYIEPNTLILTTAMAFQHDDKAFCQFIRDLSEKHAAGLAIKLGRFIDKLSVEVIETANECFLPLLQIPAGETLGAITQQILSYLWDSQAKRLSYALEFQQRFSALFLENAPIETLLAYLSDTLNRNVLLINPFLKIEHMVHLFEAESVAHSFAHQIQKIKENKNSTSQPFSYTYTDNQNQSIEISVTPIQITEFSPYYLLVFNGGNIAYPFSQLLLEQASSIIAFTLFKKQTMYESNWSMREDFFRRFTRPTNSKEKTKALMDSYGKSFGIDDKAPLYQVVLLGFDSFDSYSYADQTHLFSFLYQWLEEIASVHFPLSTIFPICKFNQQLLLLQGDYKEAKEILADQMNKLQQQFSISISIVLGSQVLESQSIWFSYVKAIDTYNKAISQDQSYFIHQYIPKGVIDLMQLLPREHGIHFATNILKELAYPRDAIHADLRLTLDTYLANQGEMTQTAKILFVHRNTVKYRIKNIEELLNLSISDPHHSLGLRIALLLTEPSF